MTSNQQEKKKYTVPCRLCGAQIDIYAYEKDINNWQAGKEYIQNCLAYLTAGERELLLSNTCDECWKKLFPNDEEDDFE